MLGRRIKRGKGLQNEAWVLFWVERSRKASDQVMCEQTLLKEVGSGQYRCSGGGAFWTEGGSKVGLCSLCSRKSSEEAGALGWCGPGKKSGQG